MYAGSTISPLSGRLLGAHQKIDRLARRNLEHIHPHIDFPTTRQILHFEGDNGPDAIKRKSPAQDEPWHYINPFDMDDNQLIGLIANHYKQLVKALRAGQATRSAFEAAWLAHAMVDGLTPAHHYPFEEKIIELRGGLGIETRTTVKEKLVFPGDTFREQAGNNWKFWGPKGVFTTHAAFEWGVATVIKPLRLHVSRPTDADRAVLRQLGLPVWFRQTAQEVAALKLYDQFYLHGWTTKLGRQVRRELAPQIVRAVSVAWYCAWEEAQQ